MAADASPVFLIRPGRPDDHAFVYRSWLDSFRQGAWAQSMRRGVFDVGHHRVIEALLERPAVQLRVAVAPEVDSVILGWALVELPNVLHFVLVKKHLQGCGIARELVAPVASGPTLRFSHHSASFERWRRRTPERDKAWTFVPYLAFFPVEGP